MSKGVAHNYVGGILHEKTSRATFGLSDALYVGGLCNAGSIGRVQLFRFYRIFFILELFIIFELLELFQLVKLLRHN